MKIDPNIISTVLNPNNTYIIEKYIQKTRIVYSRNNYTYGIKNYKIIIINYTDDKHEKDFKNMENLLNYFTTHFKIADKTSPVGELARSLYDYIIKYKSLNKILE